MVSSSLNTRLVPSGSGCSCLLFWYSGDSVSGKGARGYAGGRSAGSRSGHWPNRHCRIRTCSTGADVGRIGIGICYDIRFQELAMLYAARGAHLLCYPGAFNMTTGPLHWELLQRARAADNQLFVATCAPARDTSAGYVAWGHSTLVGPFGEVIATTEHEEATIIAEIDYSLIEQRRQFLPLQYQRRGDLYRLVDVQRSVS